MKLESASIIFRAITDGLDRVKKHTLVLVIQKLHQGRDSILANKNLFCFHINTDAHKSSSRSGTDLRLEVQERINEDSNRLAGECCLFTFWMEAVC